MILILTQFIVYLTASAFVLFLPGYCLLKAISARKKYFTSLENFVLSFGLGITMTDFLMLTLGAMKISINRNSIILAILIFSAACTGIYFLRSRKHKAADIKQEHFSKKQLASILLILGLSFFIRTIYLSGAIVPSATDLGHHMYWANTIVVSGTIPNYQQRNIDVSGGNYAITPEQNISDFIIGEHLIFAAISLLSGIGVISYFPVVTLLLIDMLSLLAVFILILRMFDDDQEKASNIGILTLLMLGPIFAIMPPQAKFIGGGVVGNIIGNFLLPLALYFYCRALKEKSAPFLSLALLFSMSLFYTHHLTAFIFMFALVLIVIAIVIINIGTLKKFFFEWSRILFSAPVIGMLVFAALFAFSVYTPTYITNRAVSTVVGGPTKTGHNGLTPTDFKGTLGEPRVTFAIAGMILLLLIYFGPRVYELYKKRRLKSDSDFTHFLPAIFLLSWVVVISIISLIPTIVHIDIPSGRVANYGTYPFAIIAAYALVELATFLRAPSRTFAIRKSFLFASILLIFIYIFSDGYYDNSQNIAAPTTAQKVQETLHASAYLAKNISASDDLLSDHINLTSDTWIKIFFMQDYNYPFYRANLDRYQNGIDRQETCTLDMVTSPAAADSKACFSGLGIDYVIVNRKTDGAQFNADPSFSLVYSNDDVNVYYKPLLTSTK
jgi:hypothetical protein